MPGKDLYVIDTKDLSDNTLNGKITSKNILWRTLLPYSPFKIIDKRIYFISCGLQHYSKIMQISCIRFLFQ